MPENRKPTPLPIGRDMSSNNERYLRWLEERWDIHKFDFYGSTEHEEERTEEVLRMLKGLGELSRRMGDPPDSPPRWELSR
jgi:hypothetical protein